MEIQQETTQQKRIQLPAFDIADIITISVLVIVGALLITDRPVPEYLILAVGLGTGKQVFTSEQVSKIKSNVGQLE